MDNELYHFGTKGHSGRYPWGSGGRPYQRLEKPKGGGFISFLKKKKGGNRFEEEEFTDEKKKAVMESGNPGLIMQYQHKLTTSELTEATNRAQRLDTLNKMIVAEADKAKFSTKFKSAMNTLDEVNKVYNTGKNTWNAVASLYNLTEDGKKKPMTKIQ